MFSWLVVVVLVVCSFSIWLIILVYVDSWLILRLSVWCGLVFGVSACVFVIVFWSWVFCLVIFVLNDGLFVSNVLCLLFVIVFVVSWMLYNVCMYGIVCFILLLWLFCSLCIVE